MRIPKVLLVVPVLAALVGCGETSPDASPDATSPAPTPTAPVVATPAAAGVTLTEADAGREVQVEVGEVLQVQLDGTPGTGYTWEVSNSNEDVLESGGQPTFAEPTLETPRVGAAGVYTFSFTARTAGQAELTFDYLRPWEASTPPAKTVAFTIQVS